MKLHLRNAVSACFLAVAFSLPAYAQQDSEAEIEKYRAQLQGGNPGELWEMKGEELWKQ